jgi:hypothetical protein
MSGFIRLGAVIGLALAAHFLPRWAWPILLVVLVVVFKLFGRRLLLIPFRLKGSALRDATATIDRLQPCERPQGTRAAADITEWWQVEVTIQPKAGSQGSFKTWEPGELVLAARGDKAAALDGDAEGLPITELELYLDARESAELASVSAHEGWHADQGWKLPGQRRLRFKFGAPDSVRHLCFRYYFESFGSLELPGRTASASS